MINKLIELEKKYPNDTELGSVIRKQIRLMKNIQCEDKANQILESFKSLSLSEETINMIALIAVTLLYDNAKENQNYQDQLIYSGLIEYFQSK